MAVKNTVGPLIKEARTKAGLTQEQLASKIDGLSASDVGKAERGEKMLTQDILKQIAKATGVTQKSLLDAARESGGTASPASASASSSSGKTSSQARLHQPAKLPERHLRQAKRRRPGKRQERRRWNLPPPRESWSNCTVRRIPIRKKSS